MNNTTNLTPKTPWKYLFGFGIFNFGLQFGLLFTGMYLGLSPGLASLVVQVQVFFSMGLAFLSSAVFLGENLDSWKLWASLFIMSGLVFSLFEKKIRKWFGNLKANIKVKNQHQM